MRILLTTIALLTALYTFSQNTIQNQVLATSGESFTDGSIVVDFTCGETFTSTFSMGTSYVITQGFQQPIRKKIGIIQPVTSLDELGNYGIEVYPNPFRGELTIEVSENSQLQVTIFDNSGRLVHTSQLSDIATTIDLSLFSVGNYQLVLTDNQNQIGRMPIIKMH